MYEVKSTRSRVRNYPVSLGNFGLRFFLRHEPPRPPQIFFSAVFFSKIFPRPEATLAIFLWIFAFFQLCPTWVFLKTCPNLPYFTLPTYAHSKKSDRGFGDSHPSGARCLCQGVLVQCRVAHRYPPGRCLSDLILHQGCHSNSMIEMEDIWRTLSSINGGHFFASILIESTIIELILYDRTMI